MIDFIIIISIAILSTFIMLAIITMIGVAIIIIARALDLTLKNRGDL